MLKYLAAAVVGFAALSPVSAMATECTQTVQRMWIGDDGATWLLFASGGIAKIQPSFGGREVAVSFAITALTTGRTVRVRYSGADASCTTERNDFVGMYLN